MNSDAKIVMGVVAVILLYYVYINCQSQDGMTYSASAGSAAGPSTANMTSGSSTVNGNNAMAIGTVTVDSDDSQSLPFLNDSNNYSLGPTGPVIAQVPFTGTQPSNDSTPFKASDVITMDAQATNYVAANPADTVDVTQSLLSSGQFLGGISTKISPKYMNYDIRHTPLPDRSIISPFLQSSYPPSEERKATFSI